MKLAHMLGVLLISLKSDNLFRRKYESFIVNRVGQKIHYYLVSRLLEQDTLCGIVVQKPGVNYSHNINDFDSDPLYDYHFSLRDKTKNKYYSGIDPDVCLKESSHHIVTKSTLNDVSTVEYIMSRKPDVLISFGVSYLKSDILSICPDASFNIHNGLLRGTKVQLRIFGHSIFWSLRMLGVLFTG